jgi:hypothetical protein
VRRASILAPFVTVFVSGVMLAVTMPGPSRGGDGETVWWLPPPT